jgi:sterol desaturase/sphingolipid hydroxylase (fatty acid hydroxylase superfamily)
MSGMGTHHRAQKLTILGHHRFDLLQSPVSSLSGHGSILSLVVHHSQLLTMTPLFAEPSAHYLDEK